MTTLTISSVLIERPTQFGNTTGYAVAEAIIPNVANGAGGGAGATVTVSIAFNPANLPSNLNYTVELSASQACAISYANKAITGFDVILTPLTSGLTLSAGTFDAVVSWQVG